MARGIGQCHRPPGPSGGAADVSRGEELLVGFAAHLRAHPVEPVPGSGADLEQRIDIRTGVDQALEVALADELLLGLREAEARHECLLVALEGVALVRRAEGCAHLVQPAPAPRQAQVKNGRVRDGAQFCYYRVPHTSRAVSTQSLSFAFSCSTVRLLPWWVLEKPHCGDRHRFSSGTNLDAASMRRLSRSWLSSCGTFELPRPSTTFLPGAT